VLYTTSCKQSSAPEDGRNYRPKNAELIEIINKIIIVASRWLFILLNYRYLAQMRERRPGKKIGTDNLHE